MDHDLVLKAMVFLGTPISGNLSILLFAGLFSRLFWESKMCSGSWFYEDCETMNALQDAARPGESMWGS